MGIKLETRDLVLKETVLEDVDTFEKWERARFAIWRSEHARGERRTADCDRKPRNPPMLHE